MQARKLAWAVVATIVTISTVSRASRLGSDPTDGPIDFDALLVQQFEQRHECCSRSSGYLDEHNLQFPFASSDFFDCWRSDEEIDTFLTTLASANAHLLTKIPEVAVTAEGRSIPAYRLSVRGGGALGSVETVYIQGLAHAREWQTGSSVVFTAASMLDGLLLNDSSVLEVVEKFDWLFVPVLNVDGFRYSLERPDTRYWRKNRRPISSRSGRVTFGVDLNRNFPVPFNTSAARGGPSSDSYAGPFALSEPETSGLDIFLRSLPLRGVLDFHAFGAQVLHPPGHNSLVSNASHELQAALERAKRLGDAVSAAMPVKYASMAASELYAAAGSLMDAAFFRGAAALTVELAGDAFVADARLIRPLGRHALRASLAFARGLPAFYSPVD